MAWELSDDRPIYLQLMEHIQGDILSGVYPLGGKLPSVRLCFCESEYNAESTVRTGAQRPALFPEDQRTLCHRR